MNNKSKTTAAMTIQNHQRHASDNVFNKYIKNIGTMNKATAYEYQTRLTTFADFVFNDYNITLDKLISKLKEGPEDPYDALSNYAAYLQNNCSISAGTLKGRIITAKNFLEYYDVDISPRRFKLKVKMPKIIRKSKEALSKRDVIEIINACSDIRLKTYVMFLAAGGFRAVEGLSIRVKDLDFESNPARVFVRGEYTKTKVDRHVFLTNEVVQQLTRWLEYKYRTRRVCYKDEHIEKIITEHRTPERNDNDSVFAVYQDREKPAPRMIYYDLAKSFAQTLDRIGKGVREDSNKRRQITLHSFRRFVKTTISDLGYADFSEYFIGHSGSTYWTKKDSEKAEIFRKIEPYLSFLNVQQLERQGADIQSKIEELEQLNHLLRQHDQIKDDAIAHLSDQLVTVSARLQELERREQ